MMSMQTFLDQRQFSGAATTISVSTILTLNVEDFNNVSVFLPACFQDEGQEQYHVTSMSNLDSCKFDLITGPRTVRTTVQKLWTQLKLKGLFIEESIYQLGALQYPRLQQLYISGAQLMNLTLEVDSLKDFPEKREKPLYILKQKVLERMDNIIKIQKKADKMGKSTSDKKVKKLDKLEGQTKVKSNRNMKQSRKLKKTDQGDQGEKLIIGAEKFVYELNSSSDKLVEQICGFKEEVQEDLKMQASALLELRKILESSRNNY
ncbi:hypothetical protein HOY82DRAFT_595816 [Tuber indicum]|nr:hypothetical protein HOY82DRAFT_595816 [Tuber indicum]